MGRRCKGARVIGPYKERDRKGTVFYRVIQIDHEGEKTTHFATSLEEAELLVEACYIDLGVPDDSILTVMGAIELFEASKRRAEAWDKRTFTRTGADLRFFAAHAPLAAVELVNPAWLRGFMDRMREAGYALAYRRGRYHAVAEFLGWCVRQGHLAVNPCPAIDRSEKPWATKRGRRMLGRGKPQLRNAGEVVAFLAAAATLGKAQDRVAVQLPMRCNMRSGEVLHLQVGDVDFVAGRIWIRSNEEDDGDLDTGWSVKSASSQRSVELPESLRADLQAICDGKSATSLLFTSNRNPGEAWDGKWLNRRIKRVCEQAEVRIVTAHGLRDTYSSFMSDQAGKSAPEIGRFLGHADEGRTARKHYIGASAHEPALKLIQGGGR